MTGEQQNPKAESPPAFGDILINPQAGTTDKKEKKSVLPPEPEKPRKQGKKTKRKQTPPKQTERSSRKSVLLCGLALLLLPAMLFLTYLAAASFLIPYYIQEHLAKQYSEQLHRPVTVTQADFAPFTFDLHLAGIHIGPEFDRQDGDEPALCRIATLDTRLRPQELLQRRIVLEDVRIKGMQTEVIRRADGSFPDLGLTQKGGAGMVDQALLPDWLRIDGLSLTDSMLVIRDVTDGHEYHLDEITFSLPSTATKHGVQARSTATRCRFADNDRSGRTAARQHGWFSGLMMLILSSFWPGCRVWIIPSASVRTRPRLSWNLSCRIIFRGTAALSCPAQSIRPDCILISRPAAAKAKLSDQINSDAQPRTRNWLSGQIPFGKNTQLKN